MPLQDRNMPSGLETDPGMDRLEAIAKLRAQMLTPEGKTRAKFMGMPPPSKNEGTQLMADAVRGTNVGMPDSALFKQRQARYFIPGTFNKAGWTNAQGETFITNSDPAPTGLANTIAHEGFHAAMRPEGMLRVVHPDQVPAAKAARFVLMQNMGMIQPESKGTPYWGGYPNSSAEEQIANLMGYEGTLPRGTPITEAPIAEKLFKPGAYGLTGVSPQELKDYYFGLSSQGVQRDALGNPVGQGIWEGQAPEPSTLQKAQATAKRIMTRLGINTERFNTPDQY